MRASNEAMRQWGNAAMNRVEFRLRPIASHCPLPHCLISPSLSDSGQNHGRQVASAVLAARDHDRALRVEQVELLDAGHRRDRLERHAGRAADASR